MKTIIFFSTFIICSFNGYSQSFKLLANDPSGDATVTFAPDIKSLSYDMNVAEDSIWFTVETYTAIDPYGDVGMMFGFDTNSVSNDGLAWNGANSFFNYDQSLLVFQNIISPNYYGYYYNSQGSGMAPLIVSRPDSFTFIIRTVLSPLDGDGNFHLLFGTGGFDILATRAVFDESPDVGYFDISAVTGVSQSERLQNNFSVFPNPCHGDKINISSGYQTNVKYALFCSGRMVMEGKIQDNAPVDISGLKSGMYEVVIFHNENPAGSLLFVKD